jgi:uncharacterized iron-regulated membrane protein
MHKKIIKIAAQTRWFRTWHRAIGVVAAFIFLLITTSGLLLIWKKNSNGYLLAETMKGSNMNANNWISLHDLQITGINILKEKLPGMDTTIDRIDVRPDKGMAKVRFKNHYHALQIDLATGQLLYFEIRRADFIEKLHDGSLFDEWLGSNFIKLSYGSLAGLSLLFLSVSGFFLWVNPRRIRQIKHHPEEGKKEV